MDHPIFVIAGDHPMARAGLCQALRSVVPTAEIHEGGDLDETRALVSRLAGRVDLLLLDLDMPGMPGFVGLLSLLSQWPALPVVVVSDSEDGAVIGRAQACGASGFIPKTCSISSIGEAVVSVLTGRPWFPGPRQDGALAGTASLVRRLASLTAQQMRVLEMVVAGKLNKQIAADLSLAEQTVKGHVTAILRKLDVYSRTQAVLAVAPLIDGRRRRAG